MKQRGILPPPRRCFASGAGVAGHAPIRGQARMLSGFPAARLQPDNHPPGHNTPPPLLPPPMLTRGRPEVPDV